MASYLSTVLPHPDLAEIPFPHDPDFDLSSARNYPKHTKRPTRNGELAEAKKGGKRFLRRVTSSTIAPQVYALWKHSVSSSLSAPSKKAGSTRPPSMAVVENIRHGHARGNSFVGGPISGLVHRPSLADNIRTASAASPKVHANSLSTITIPGAMGEEKLLASGNGVSVSITLAEPMLFLQGFDQSEVGERTTTMLRGTLSLRVSKSAKIKTISLNFRGRAETEWPEGIPPKRTEFKDKESIMNHTWPFFNAQFQTAEYGSGADQVHSLKGPSTTTREIGCSDSSAKTTEQFKRAAVAADANVSAKDARRLSLQVNQSRSFGKGESANGGTMVAQKGYRTFTPGVYVYNFELPIDSRLPETISVDLGSVKYELEATVERAGAFRANLVGSKEVILIRAPAEGSLEQVEPIAISRNWEDQLHYDIVISGKSFPLGAQVPIAFKLTPLAKVQCHRIKVFVTENVHYYTNNKQVHRLEPTKKIQLFEKRADGPSTSAYPGSSMRITAGGGVAYEARAAAASGDENVLRDTTNLLGDLDGDTNVGPTEMEFNVQLPNCHSMKERDKMASLHFDTTYQAIQVHHWIKVCCTQWPTIYPVVLSNETS